MKFIATTRLTKRGFDNDGGSGLGSLVTVKIGIHQKELWANQRISYYVLTSTVDLANARPLPFDVFK
jgi:hypothetical protein